jgi:DNA adenine methylase
MKSLLRYPGGKSRMLSILQPYLLELVNGEAHYVEPFVGGGSVALEIAKTKPSIRLALNDKDELVASLWRIICGQKAGVEELCHRIDVVPNPELYRQIKGTEYGDIVGKAFKCLFLNRTSFNGVLRNSSFLCGSAQKTWLIGHRYQPDVLARLLRDYHSLLAGRTTVSCEDALGFIDRHDDYPLFVDPPYFPSNKPNKLYGIYMGREEHERLASRLATVRKCVVTYDYCETVRGMFGEAGFSIAATTGYYSSGKSGHGYLIDDGSGPSDKKWKTKVELIGTKGIEHRGCMMPLAPFRN